MTNPPPGYGYEPPRPPEGYAVPPPAAWQQPPPGYPYPPQPVSPDGRPLASFADRLLARLIDGAILGAAVLVLVIPVIVCFAVYVSGLDTNANGEISDQDTGPFVGAILGLYALIFLIFLGAQYIYEVEMMFRSGQTYGKRIMKIRIIPIQPGAPMTRGIAAKRFLVQTIAGSCVGVFALLDGLWQLWDKPYQQCLHDKFATTVVVKT